MTTAEAKGAFEDLVSRYALRHVERTECYLGIHEGVCLDASFFHQCIRLTAIAPAAVINEQILEDFSGFTHVKESGVPTSWINGVPGKKGNYPDRVAIEITPQRLKLLTEKQVLDLPANLAQDFRLFGAEPTIAQCQLCGEAAPNSLLTIDDHYVPACENCLTRARDEAAVGNLHRAAPVRWLAALPALLVGAALYTLAWGGMQQADSMPAKLLLVAPFGAAILLSAGVGWCAQGTSFLLRLMTAAVTIASVFAGNIWGTRTAILEQFQQVVSWEEAARIYFQFRLPQNPHEGYFLLGGIAGAWVGMQAAKAFSKVQVD